MAPPRSVPPGPVPFKLRLRQLRTDAGLSWERLAYLTYDQGRPVSAAAIRKYEEGRPVGSKEKGPRERAAATRQVYESLAAALEVDPSEFPEYRLHLMRESLDEAVVGLDIALATLELVEAATSPTAATAPPATAGRPKRLSQRRTPQAPAAPRKRSAGS